MKLADTRLGPILEAVKSRADNRSAGRTDSTFWTHVNRISAGPQAVETLRSPTLSVIAECKRRSPSAGTLAKEADLSQRAMQYAEDGAAAISILTEQDHFGGSLEDFVQLQTVPVPRLRKDFLLNEFMVEESAQAGADLILLLAVCLEDAQLQEMTQQAHELNMAVLLEVHGEQELERALATSADCIGVNARNLCTFEVDPTTTLRLLPQIPDSFVRVAESGLKNLGDLRKVADAGADAALVGTALMHDPRQLATWTTALEEHAS